MTYDPLQKGPLLEEFTGSARLWHLWQSFKENMDSNLVCFLIIESQIAALIIFNQSSVTLANCIFIINM